MDYCEILKHAKNIAVVGISSKLGRDSGLIANFLRDKGYNVVGVNPIEKDFNGFKVYKSLKEVPFKVDIVDIFRRSEFVDEIVDEAIEVGAKVIWMQLGVENEHARSKAIAAGMQVVMNHCIAVEYRNCNF
ncbi:MAG: CoA-binding protein [Ignavibacteria bacterium]|nr:CoA-binding protein [Ignavibacteria bacterium]